MIVALIGLVPGTPARAVELRSSCGSRPIVRTVSTMRVVDDGEQTIDESEFVEPMADSVLSDGTEIYQMGPDSYGPTAFGDACCGAASCGGSSCGMVACRPMAGGFWVDLDFLVWWRKGYSVPPLVTTSPNAGVLPEANILLGGQHFDERPHPGGRVEFGMWLEPCQRFGIGGRYLALGESKVDWTLTSADQAVLARPFFNVSTDPGTQDAFLVANGIDTTGEISVLSNSDFQAADVYLRWALCKSCWLNFDFLLGYQYARIDEGLGISSLTAQGVDGPAQTLAVTDLFDTKNDYHGAYFGFQGEYRRCEWGLEMLARFGFGNMDETVSITGTTVATDVAGGVVQTPEGLYARSTNIGTYSRSEFSYMQDVGVRLNYYPWECTKFSVGYGLMYFSQLVRPGNAIDFSVPVPPSDTATQPAFAWDPTFFFAHGLTLGLEYRF
jgi:hypothetical protein